MWKENFKVDSLRKSDDRWLSEKQAKEIKEDIGFFNELFPRLFECKKQYVDFFPGGKQQMLAVVRELMSDPSFNAGWTIFR